MAQDSLLLRWQKGGGIDSLIAHLREKGFAVGASEALDAARLVAHLARTDRDAEHRVDPAWLMPKLRPILCKHSEEQERFGQAFTEWAELAIHPQRISTPRSEPQPTSASPKESETPSPWPKRALISLLILAMLWLGNYVFTQFDTIAPPSTSLPHKHRPQARLPPKAPLNRFAPTAKKSFTATFPPSATTRNCSLG